MSEKRGENYPSLVEIMRTLLGPEGCPWDREQTLKSLRPYVIEEAYEVVEAVDAGEAAQLREELGDLLFLVVFQTELARRRGWFDHDDVIGGVCEKMERRHPWVFGDEEVDGVEGSSERWEAMKAKEKVAEKGELGALDGVPSALPALLRAVRVGEKASAVGYDWPDAGGPRQKIDEELAEMDEALERGSREHAERELGDLLFSIASFARKEGFNPEASLRGALSRFTDRFGHAEASARADGKSLRELDEASLDELWRRAKDAL